ncbi:hypothetical protein Thein_1213 [Thermodesulfatator indicus DSM 15286]|uniref:Uncharacterized protein n=1 Tax=Thermodesulfatator indicus (strain DSM 15286 / JCM 11887 / CIR29812) TaxID=667014 RepID=F8A8J5_THEID|nr:hypothetical protein [Thermodesulfatator indicus]AEH45081.1 hypothetical protein Thein_1213 [Thermodesulfatator indicus DSM 15286]
MNNEIYSKLNQLMASLQKELPIKFFNLTQIPEAVSWAETGGISVHENFYTRRRFSYHVISASKENLEAFCHKLGLPKDKIKASEFYRFWHLTWTPFSSEPKPKRRRGRPPKKAISQG